MLEVLRHIKADLSSLDKRASFALVYAAVGLTCITYLKDPAYLRAILAHTPFSNIGDAAFYSRDNNLYALIWWVTVSVTFYFIVPALFVRFIQKRKLSEVGIAARVEPGFLKLLAVCIAIMLPLIFLMSLTGAFAAKYPFLKIYNDAPYTGTILIVWEAVYFLQFFGLEFFFRGFLVHSLKPSLGLYSILAMTVPYTMIHFQKPMAETFAAVFAGLFLGWISYRNGTIWLGLVLHCTVAFSMDILALYNKGLLF
ncbi:MAG: CPBP family intramembrane metalloprotease [Chloracidobacterium sp.]|nr:CPBP family intramembrane metalloprotease [Chloracidobacterium sp.]MCC6826294.1 CPBP family intramembrane metalloprotease [Acidobacteriota bacterium]MCO5333041.1 CPBP family intramembrane metalloprotease [Pyrinomonadaceae bacterium]